MSPMNDDDRPLGSLFGKWQADEPPEGFSSAVVGAFEAERQMRSSRWAPRGVVIPLLLAGAFVSFGAAAAFSERALRNVESGQEETFRTPLSVEKAPPLFFHGAFESGRAEPDALTESARSVRPESPASATPEEVEEAEPSAPETPRVVHFPRCECGTSGVVCTCSD